MLKVKTKTHQEIEFPSRNLLAFRAVFKGMVVNKTEATTV